VPSPSDLNRGLREAQDALARRLPRYEDVHARALRSLGAIVAEDLGAGLVAAAAWEGRDPEALTAELRRRHEARWLARHNGAVETVRAEAWRTTIDALASALGVAFDLANPVLDGAFRRLANRTDLARSAWEMIQEGLQAAYDDGLGIPETARELRTRVAALAPVRARAIARTELIGMSNAGSVAAARLSGAAAWKQWLATNDARTRPEHAAAAGQVVRLNDSFTVGGESLDYPGDPAGSARNVVNCRCTTLYVDGPEGYEGPVGSSALLAAALACGCS
jgi:hypothetical protein